MDNVEQVQATIGFSMVQLEDWWLELGNVGDFKSQAFERDIRGGACNALLGMRCMRDSMHQDHGAVAEMDE